ncbi:hypothetical protein [Mycobacteroides abscessus]|uniref:hypothetical protein n=1 Tax=Mycobacteroides abscessus TaxID=36809 RepID=UPI0009A67190|nr:hypothetical protein [Mycobacteroides abscessus]UVK63438.1 hypothetical protein SEA_BAUDELAIRE_62 [Mycobacterium phage Baudelaire]WKW86554.1 hypothetical protein SEA_AEGEUS_62 [Mycobacterium phage Aegeus]SKT46468.1 Uncharacterised protein [Mycobacteroides abscessus subsp. bolletii]
MGDEEKGIQVVVTLVDGQSETYVVDELVNNDNGSLSMRRGCVHTAINGSQWARVTAVAPE